MEITRIIMKVDEKLIKNFFRVKSESHITIDQELCKKSECEVCVRICPAGLYELNEDGKISVEYTGCLECGTCWVSCPYKAIKWEYPSGGFGVQYRYG
jgi:ferredoxin like protein